MWLELVIEPLAQVCALDWESNPQPFGNRTTLHSSEPHWVIKFFVLFLFLVWQRESTYNSNQFFFFFVSSNLLGSLGLQEKSENDSLISQMDLNLLLHRDKFYSDKIILSALSKWLLQPSL